MLVLGVVRIFQPVHGYDVRRELVQWHAVEWGNVAPGSIYNALKTLVKEEMIEVVGTEHVGGRPERTSYRLTPRGERELGELLREALWTVRMPIDPLVAVISIMGFLKRDELIAALEARRAQITGSIAHAEHAIGTVDDVETPAHVREMLRLLNARMGSELAWSKAFVARLQAGEYDTADDPPWRDQAAAKREPEPTISTGPAKSVSSTSSAKPAKSTRSAKSAKSAKSARSTRSTKPATSAKPAMPVKQANAASAANAPKAVNAAIPSKAKPASAPKPAKPGRDARRR
jgi:DNA-binding PadR family transcriptional regulator